MTLGLCAGLCADYNYFGVEGGDQCFCGNSLNSGYPEVSGTQCNYTCAGNGSQSCGGLWYTNIYRLSPANPGVDAHVAEGCYADNGTDRVLNGALQASAQFMTTELCAGLCTGSRLFGLEYSTQCFCGDALTFNISVPSSNCNFTCSGDPTQLCGGIRALDLYSFT